MRGLFRQGAFQQSASRAESDSFFVICDSTRQPADRDRRRAGEHRRRLRAAQARRVRRHHHHPDHQTREPDMAEFTVNPTRYDPYKTHMFRVKWDGVYVAGLSKMGPLTRTTAPVSHRVGGDPSHDRRSPGPDHLHRGDAGTRGDARPRLRGVGEQGVAASPRRGSRCPTSARTSSSTCSTRPGQQVISYHLYRCWVSEYTALPALDAATAAIAIQTIKLEIEGWERDTSVHRAQGTERLSAWTDGASRRRGRGSIRGGPGLDTALAGALAAGLLRAVEEAGSESGGHRAARGPAGSPTACPTRSA